MAKYWVRVTLEWEDEVEADNEEEAIAITQEDVYSNHYGYWTNEIEELKEEEE